MNPFSFLFTWFALASDVLLDALFGFLEWLKVNDFSGARRRRQSLQDAPDSYASDHLPVVLAADQGTSLLYDDRGLVLRCRTSKRALPVTPRMARRFARRGMKGLKSASRQLTHQKTANS